MNQSNQTQTSHSEEAIDAKTAELVAELKRRKKKHLLPRDELRRLAIAALDRELAESPAPQQAQAA